MIYLDNAATDRYKPQCMFEALMRECSESSNPGRASHSDAIACAMRIGAVREDLQRLLGADDDFATVFCLGCTEALNLAILGLADELDGGAVVTTVTEHNSVLRPLRELSERRGVDIRIARPSEGLSVRASDIEPLLDDRVKAVIVNAVSNVTGIANDIDEIWRLCRSKDIITIVDGAQALGHVPLSLQGKSKLMLAAAGHKGLHGPQGVGFLVFDKSIPIKPIRFGGTGTESADLRQPRGIPEGFESGTLNAAAIIALGAAAKWTYANLDSITARLSALSESAQRGLSSIKGVRVLAPSRTGVLSFTVDGYDSAAIADYLNDNNIAVRAGLHCAPLMHEFLGTSDGGAVRVGIGFCNTPYHIEKLVRCMRLFCKR